MMKPLRWIVVTSSFIAFVAACGGEDEAAPGESGTATEAATTTSPATPELVGRWEQVHSCDQLVRALTEERLADVAPAMVGDYFPNEKPTRLAQKKDVCEGAKPEPHSHFFTHDGTFGSLDEDGNQVDEAPYTIVSDNVLRIGKGEFRYRIEGDNLLLDPVIPPKERKRALAEPLKFSPAGWQVAVSYEGHPWKRVECAGWC